MTKANLIISIQ